MNEAGLTGPRLVDFTTASPSKEGPASSMPSDRPHHRTPAEVERHQRSVMFRLWVDEATDLLLNARDGGLHPAAAAWDAHATLGRAVRMLLDGPVDGWPCDEAAA